MTCSSLIGHHYDMLFIDWLQDVQDELVSAWLDHLTAGPRAAQLLPKDSPLLTTLEETMSRYLKDVRRGVVKTDKRLVTGTCVYLIIAWVFSQLP